MSEQTINTSGGANFQKDVNANTVVGRDLNLFNSALPRYLDLVRRVRAQPRPPSASSSLPRFPLVCYQEARPQSLHSSVAEVEVRVALISQIDQPIHIIQVAPPPTVGANDLLGWWTSPRLDIKPFCVLPALRYIVSKETYMRLHKNPGPPQIRYQVGDESAASDEIKMCVQMSDGAGLFVPLVDQEGSRDEIEHCLEGVRQMPFPRWLAFSADWGKGRSRVLTECACIARQKGFEVFIGDAGSDAESEHTADPIRRAINAELRLPAENAERDIECLIGWLEQSQQPSDLNDTDIAALEQYLRDGTDHPENLEAVITCLLQRARKHPVLLAIDNLHNAPYSTCEILQELADRLMHFSDLPLVICATFDSGQRKSDHKSDLISHFQGRIIPLEELALPDVWKMVQSWFPELECPPDLHESLVRFLGRRPLLVRQSLNCLAHTGQLQLKRGRWVLQRGFEQAVQPGLHAFVDIPRGLESLLAEYRTLRESNPVAANGLRLAAAIGVNFEYDLWQQAMLEFEQCTSAQARHIRDGLIALDFIVPPTDEEDIPGTYKITPPIIRKLIWQEIQSDSVLARDIHGLIARLLVPRTKQNSEITGRLAYQLLWSQDKARLPEVFKMFCELAQSPGHNLDSTLALYESAMKAAGQSQGGIPPNSVYEARYQLAQTLEMRGRWQEAFEIACKIAAECEEAQFYQLAAQAQILAGWTCFERQKVQEALQHYDQAARLLLIEPQAEIEALLLRKKAAWYADMQESEVAIRLYQNALQLSQSDEDKAQTLGSYAEFLRRLHRFDEASKEMEGTLQLCKTLPASAIMVVARVHIQAGALAYHTRDLDTSRARFEKSLDLAKSQGALKEWAHAESWLGTVCSEIEHNRPDEPTLMHYAYAAELFELLDDRRSLMKLLEEYIPSLLLAERYHAVLRVIDRAAWLGIVDNLIGRWRNLAEAAVRHQARDK